MRSLPIALWISDCEALGNGDWTLEALDFHEEFDGPGTKWRRRHIDGATVFIGPHEQLITQSRICLVHLSHRSWTWVLSGQCPPLEPPFLVTNDLQTHMVFEG